MDTKGMMNMLSEVSRRQRVANAGQLTLGGLLEKLKKAPDTDAFVFVSLPPETETNCKPVIIPTYFASWRGAYEEIALGFTSYDPSIGYYGGEQEFTRVADLIEQVKRAIGATFAGYKGGDFLMGADTPVWLANRGNSGIKWEGTYDSYAIVDVEFSEKNMPIVSLRTKVMEY